MEILLELFNGVFELSIGKIIMYLIGLLLIYLAVKKDYEPMLLLPIGFGAILVNLPFGIVWEHDGAAGFLQVFYNVGIITELFPIMIFIAVGAMIDFTPLLKTPKMLLFGAAAQFGIFFTIIAALALGKAFPGLNITLKDAAAIGIIGAADGPTSIFVARLFSPTFLGPITVAAYSYMSLVPIIQPPVIKALTTKEERCIRMEFKDIQISKMALIAFPIVVTIVSGILAPISVPLIGSLMFGNLIRVCGVLEKLSNAAQNELANLVTLVLGITIGATMKAEDFLQFQTLLIMALGLVAFIFDTAGGVLFAKFLNLFSKQKVNPMIGAAGISAFPMSSRIVQKLAKEADPTNFILMQAVSANVSGQLGSVVAGAIILAIVPVILGM
ncbi:sodium ion-translocating decarboxylase subunit beta [Anaeropeptidivorans aminofermentans]|uniref:sodium ion-translocating decarboxylase subunit beta n=1 Tax=Anaeropeptidivorans aminofermentans TaxID=2934315 RepID=UPI0020241607|nr:sodium ion-translocating decarboxylase subunit beta [Anaeropeptidivorans aminofermentans]MBE6012455.1 sodium ion-translocating decarboxylase subunit beta [Lachnospiraceae bacterium]